MYPRISDLINDIFGTDILLPAKTFGFFLALAFIAAYIPIRAELKRREALGHYRRKKVKVMTQGPIHIREVVIHTLLWGLVCYKLGYYFIDPDLFNNDTEAALLSTKGFWLTGLIGAAAGGGWKYLEYSKKKNLEVKHEEVVAGPSFYFATVVTIAFVAGILGSKIFAMLEPGSNFWHDPLGDLASFNGLSFYGGLICAGILIIWYLKSKGFGILPIVDAFAPGLILAYAVGRIGCQMSGDGDWGIPNTNPKPGFLSWLPDWAWAYKYPHNVAMEDTQVLIPNCDPAKWGTYCHELAQPAYPTPLYETLMGLAIFGFLWAIRKKMKYPGQVTAIWLMLIAIERFSIEKIRVNTTYDLLGLHFTQAEFISFILLIGGAAILYYAMKTKKPLVVEKN